MEMEELNKSQIVLLTLLVSFVTSLATGIATVSLMEQGVSPVTNTVNKIVERTKEIIVKVPEPQDPVVIKETETVIVHQSDLVASAVAKNTRTSTILYKVVPAETQDSTTDEAATTPDTSTVEAPSVEGVDQAAGAVLAIGEAEQPTSSLVFASRAVVIGGGIIIVDASALEEEAEYKVRGPEGEIMPATLKSVHNGIAVFNAETGRAANIGDPAGLERGQAVIVLSGTARLRVITAIVSDIVLGAGGVTAIEIDKSIKMPGSMLINIDGELVGISTGASRVDGDTWFTTSDTIKATLASSTEDAEI